MGEVTITLDDVAFLLHMPITGVFHSFETLYVDEAVLMLVELLEVGANEARAKTVQCHGAYVRLSWLRDIYRSKCDVAHWTVAAQAYLLHLLGCTLFSNKSATRVHVVFLDAFRDLSQSGSYACEATALVHMYDNLNDASKSSVRELKLISCFSGHIRWDLIVVIHRSERVVQKFGYVQAISPHSSDSRLCLEDIDDILMHFSDYLAPVGQIFLVPAQYAPNYMD
ncbi:Protein MAIN-LIKE 1 [Glycine soja]